MLYTKKSSAASFIHKTFLFVLFICYLLAHSQPSFSQELTLPSPAPLTTTANVITINAQRSNPITLTLGLSDLCQILVILLLLCLFVSIFIRKTLLSKKEIESLNFNLRRNHSKFKSLFNDTSDPIILIKDGYYVDVNLATLKLLGYLDKKDLLKTKAGSLSPSMQPDGTSSSGKIHYQLDLCERIGSSRFEWQCQKSDGQVLWLEVALTKVVFNKETLIHMVCRDIDEMKKLQSQNTVKKAQLEQSNKELLSTIENLKLAQDKLVATEKMAALGALVAGISHEINTPVGISLTSISHFESMTLDIIDDFNNQRLSQKSLTTYLANCQKVCHLTNTNLNRAATLVSSFKQIAVDQTSEEMRVFNVKEYIDEILSSLHSVTKTAVMTINVNCPDDLVVESYPGALSQIVTNLIMNSVIHGFKNIKEGKIDINVSCVEDLLSLKYSDNGVGIEAKNLAKIFDPFFTTNRNDGGSGLGLNIIYNIINNIFNGDVECKSTLNQGTTFHIKLSMALTKNMLA